MAKLRTFLLIASSGVGALAAVACGLFAVAGAGIYGTPFQGTDREDFLLFLTLLLGPLAILPGALLDWRLPGKGGLMLCGFALADAAAIAAYNERLWGFAIHDAARASLCLAAPAFLIGSLLFFSARPVSLAWSAPWIGTLAIGASIAGFYAWHVGRDGIELGLHFLTGGTV